jgi:hypothetical protein
MPITTAYHPVKIRHKDTDGTLDLGGGLSRLGDPVFATDSDARTWYIQQTKPADGSERTLDPREKFICVPAVVFP